MRLTDPPTISHLAGPPLGPSGGVHLWTARAIQDPVICPFTPSHANKKYEFIPTLSEDDEDTIAKQEEG